MNEAQALWWRQAKSDFETFELLRGRGVAACHTLHYLQMSTEKLAKASFWASNQPPAMRHVGFAQFLRRFGKFLVWNNLKKSQGRKLMRFISTAIDEFPQYASE